MLREKLEELAREHAEALRQVEVLREQLGAAGNEQDGERRQGERLAAQLELQQAAHLESSKELSAEAGRLRDYSNELIFVMIMHGLAPDAVSEPSSSSRSGPDDESSAEEVDAAAVLEPAALLAQNKRLAGEVARLRAQIARAVALSRQVDRGWQKRAGLLGLIMGGCSTRRVGCPARATFFAWELVAVFGRTEGAWISALFHDCSEVVVLDHRS